MYLRSLTLQGFKSFPDKTVLSFGRGMTAVVGPNGSGKSNIADAVRWVLGEQSTKSLRGTKMEDVIFSGAKDRAAHGFAQVTLTLDNTDRRLSLDEDTVAVTRIYYRSGESEYKLNGKSVRLRDINELFMDTGLGRDGYSMVSQGRIEDMVSAKSGDRRDMLEEASGISHYRYRRAETLKRLELAEENLVRLRDIMTELEGRVGPLATQAKKAERYLKLADERRTLEIGLWLITSAESEKDLREIFDKLTVVTEQYKDVESSLASLFESIDAAEESGRRVTVEIEQTVNRAGELETGAAQAENAADVADASATHCRDTVERIDREIADETSVTGHLDEEIAQADEKTASLAKLIEEQNAKQAQAAGELAEAQDRAGRLTGKVRELSDKLASILLDISRCEVNSGSSSSSAAEISERLLSLSQTGEAISRQVAEASAGAVKAGEACRSAVAGYESDKNALDGIRLSIDVRAKAAAEAKKDVDDCSIAIADKTNRLNFLIDTEKNMEGYYGSVKAVIKEASHGVLTGIRGTVSQLIRTQPDYSTAIETALGSAIQDIVTDTDADAKRAIYFLKSNNLGRCTFLPVSSIRSRDLFERGIDRCPGYIGVAASLVECDGAYREIISSLLGRTVVAEDLDRATEIARQFSYKFKIVTLDGQVINAGGSMTGGSRPTGSSFLSRAGNIETLRNEVAALREKLASLSAKSKKCDEALSSQRAALAGAEADLSRAAEKKIRAEEAEAAAKKALTELHARLSELETEKALAESRRARFMDDASGAEKEKAALTEAADQVRTEMSKLSGGSAQAEDDKMRLGDELNNINLTLVGLMKERESADAAAGELRRRRASHGDKSSALTDEKDESLRTIDELTRQAAEQRQRAVELRQQAADTRASVKKLSAGREAFEKEVSDGRIKERDMTDTREKLASEKVRLEERRDSLTAARDEADSKLYSEYGLTVREAGKLGIEIPDPAEARRTLAAVRGSIKALGNVNVGAVDEYKEVSERYEFMKTQVQDVESSKAELSKLTEELTETMAARFREVFSVINGYFAEAFSRLFGGGTASLFLEDETDILESEIGVRAQPPGKNVRNMTLLSGGEKGLCAIALLFAIQKVNPAPFCIFDEVEAALDDVNVVRYAEFVRSMTDRTQFILITHRRGTMEEADTLYGVTMQEEGVSKLLELNTAEMAQKLGLT